LIKVINLLSNNCIVSYYVTIYILYKLCDLDITQKPDISNYLSIQIIILSLVFAILYNIQILQKILYYIKLLIGIITDKHRTLCWIYMKQKNYLTSAV